MTDSSEAKKKEKLFDSRYKIFEIVGRGASSVVYRAKHVLSENKELALKVLLPKNGKSYNSDLLRHESLALITARHKYVIRLEDFRSVDSLCYLAMEFAPSSNLRDYSEEKDSKLPPTQIERFFTQASEGLAFLHNIGMLHRDIKPENILVLNDRQIRLSDFGVSTLPGQTTSFEELKKGVGTLDYMAPEVFTGANSGPAADVYSLALTFYELFSGTHPFKDLSIAKAVDAREKTDIKPLTTINPDIPQYISDAITKSLQANLEERFANAMELSDFIQNKNTIEVKTDKQEVEIEAPPAPEAPEPEESKTLVEEPETPPVDTSAPLTTEEVEDVPEAEPAEPIEKIEEEIDQSPEKIINTETEDEEPDFNEFNYQQEEVEGSTPLWQKVLFIVITAFAIGLVVNVLSKMFFSDSAKPPQTTKVETQAKTEISVFPLLKNGIYNGFVSGIKNNQEIPLTIISIEKENLVTVMLGLEGWNPIPINLNQLTPQQIKNNELIAKSNGINLHLKGIETNGLLTQGTFTIPNIDLSGTWKINRS